METSIIIRTRNEQRWIGSVLERLFAQTYRDFEVIIVDSGSTDNTLDIASKFPVTIIKVDSTDFTYPYALNLGIRSSQAEKYLVILSAHSLPISKTWLADGIKHFSNPKVMGVYGPLKALPDGTFWDKLFHSIFNLVATIICFPKSYIALKKARMGVLGFTNAIIRKDLWEQHNLDERYANGGEDGEWVKYWLSKDLIVIMDLKFSVHHSHYLNLRQWLQQYKYWSSVSNPQPFQRLKYRTGDETHKEI